MGVHIRLQHLFVAILKLIKAALYTTKKGYVVNNPDIAISSRSSPINSHIKKIENYINEKFHQTALDNLKKQIITKVTKKRIYPALNLY